MPKLVRVEQGTDQWRELRERRLGASEAATVMGISPWKTRYQLYRQLKKLDQPEKTGGPKGTVNWAIERGNRWEPAIRARYEIISDLPMPPAVYIADEFDWMLASLDGINESAKKVLEIKAPGKETFEKAKAGIIVPHYAVQLEQQLFVTKMESVDFFCAKIEKKNGKEQIVDTALINYRSNPALRDLWLKAAIEFMEMVDKNEPPPLEEKDVLIIDSEDAKETFTRIGDLVRAHDAAETAFDAAEGVYLRAKEEYERIDQELKSASKDIARFVTHPRVRGFGLYVAEKVFKRGKEYHFKVSG